MPWWLWSLLGVVVLAAVWAAFLVWLVAVGRREDARMVATLIPDCIVLVIGSRRNLRVHCAAASCSCSPSSGTWQCRSI